MKILKKIELLLLCLIVTGMIILLPISHRNNILWHGIHKSSLTITKFAITYLKANPNIKNHFNLSPLCYLPYGIVFLNNTQAKKIFDFLIENKADINYTFRLAAADSSLTINILNKTTFLLENGADINSQDSLGDTALMYAIKFGSIENAKFLIKKGADIHIVNNYFETALDLAKKNELNEIIQILEKYNET